MTPDVITDAGQQTTALARRTGADLLRRVENRLRSLLAAERDRWAGVHERAVVPLDALLELITSGGKRIRPTFCITGYLAGGGDPEDPGIVAAGAALEMLHVSALVHDDLLDAFGDPADTGKPTGLDFTQHKMTLLLGWAMQRDEHIHTLITEPGHTPDEVRRRLLDTGVPADVEKHIADLVERGCKAVADAPVDQVWRTELAVLAVRVAHRSA